jgi:hypothetical protein
MFSDNQDIYILGEHITILGLLALVCFLLIVFSTDHEKTLVIYKFS